ncbi:Abi family protein [Mitsuaria sp. GD03876]|uniref:Abi family protein n=1 Tax=Mitsuaria sp. GD03876 TaxID=2975399 RepID=UPI0024481211|nr:Abi family protein [Mitsuaria sp. GD03876]MDH0866367.1 Abi family protein [Mitsuaria sp. GD03876]
MSVDNDEDAIQELSRFGYYRLSGYYYPLRKSNPEGEPGRRDEFVEGASFDLVVALADFDKRLRLLALDGIEAIEVAVRVAIAHRMGKVSALAHLNPDLLDRKFTRTRDGHADSLHDAWRGRFADLCSKSKEDFWLHHVERYGGQMPIWAAIELWDFGLLSRFYEGMQQRDRDAIAAKFVPKLEGPTLVNWLKMLNFVRNVAAHHSRLWNRNLPDLAKLPPLEKCRLLQPLHESEFSRRRIFGAFSCLRLLLRTIHPASNWPERVKALISTFPQTPLISIESAGFKPGWMNCDLWR